MPDIHAATSGQENSNGGIHTMHIKSTIINIMMALLIPLSAAAKQPVADGCEILVTGSVNPSIPFTVKVAKTPAYPGQWIAPTVSVEIMVPVNPDISPGPNSYSQTVTQTIDGLGGSNDALATFVIHAFSNLVFTQVEIFATVGETLGKNKQSIAATCNAVTVLR